MSERKVILIIEDQSDIRKLIRMTLELGDSEIHEAENGESGWHMVKALRPDLVLLDVMMPKKSGFEVCQEIRSDPEMAGVRILMLTAKGRDTEVAKGLALGADAYMTKPFSTRELVDKVRNLLEQ